MWLRGRVRIRARFILTELIASVKIEVMKIEGMRELDVRVAKHAALSDPARLQIMDRLTLGDVSPTELQTQLGMSSNLLAHHLGVLESAGMLGRHRSEADRRRSYLHLAPGAFDGIQPGATDRAYRVVFVCTANSARSQLASALWQHASRIPATSAGTHPADRIDPRAIATARRAGLTLPAARPRSIAGVLGEGDFVITVCDTAHEELGDTGGLHWSVPDPVRTGTDAAFDVAFADIAGRIGELAPRLASASIRKLP